ncbi:MAG: FtsQ-type POTRA domain-containing protein [Anaerolineales bacterium]|nr:FtsQ-type POTRA domain-containing protein [Anaerolineales bacterium]
MSSVGKRRRERIQAKRIADKENAEGHVSKAPGRLARVSRRKAMRDARQTDTGDIRAELPVFIPDGDLTKPELSLRQRRLLRRRVKERQDGLDRPDERVRPIGVIWISWRWLSGSISLFLIILLYFMLGSDAFIIDTIAVGGERYLTPEQVFEATGAADRNLFKLDARSIEARLETNPSIGKAEVYIGWPPNAVSVFITERDPALIWEQGNFRVWVDVNGIVMFQREERDDLLRIVYPDENLDALTTGDSIDWQIVAGALQLKSKRPSIKVMLYDPVKGLGIREEGNWVAWFGIGLGMEQRLLVYDAIVNAYYPSIQFEEVDVSDPHHPTFVDRFYQQ